MKTVSLVSSIIAASTMAMLPVKAQVTYLSPNSGWVNGGYADGAGIGSVVVNNTASTITFTVNTTQPMASWILYAIQLQIVGQAGSGSTVLSNPLWGSGGPSTGISSGENAVLNFNDASGGGGGNGNTGAAAYKYSGGWNSGVAVTYNAGGVGSSFATATVSLSSLGLSVGDSFYFDAVSTYQSWNNGSPQSAYGALDTTANPKETDGAASPWNPSGSTYYDSATDAGGTIFGTAASMYTVTAVPEPATCALLGLGALAMIGCMRRNAK